MSKHTPTPWYTSGGSVWMDVKDSAELICEVERRGEYPRNEEGEANAAHIVKCVNLHDELTNALETFLCSGWGPDDLEHLWALVDRAKAEGK